MKRIFTKFIRPYYDIFRRLLAFEERQFRKNIFLNKNKCLKIVVGSSGLSDEGWISSEAYFLDLLKEKDWLKYFDEGEIDYILAEHVWEHLTIDQGIQAARTCYRFIKKGGKLRVAVPDGFHFNPEYIEYVKPGGRGPGAYDHKVLYNFRSFSSIFQKCGFGIELLEYFDENKEFHSIEWNKEEGFIHRSLRYDSRNSDGQPNYTSLILDAIKF